MRILFFLALLNFATACFADEAPRSVVNIVDCDGRETIVVVPEGGAFQMPKNPCTLMEEKAPPSSFICADGTCFPRSFVLVPLSAPSNSQRDAGPVIPPR